MINVLMNKKKCRNNENNTTLSATGFSENMGLTVSVTGNQLTMEGERKQEKKEEKKDYL